MPFNIFEYKISKYFWDNATFMPIISSKKQILVIN